MKLMFRTAILILALPLACTKVEHQNERGHTPAPAPAQDEGAIGPEGQSNAKELKLKSTDMLAQSIFAALGPGKTVKRDESGATRDLMADFRRNFGGTSSLRLGEVYADSPSVAYVLALGIVGMNAGAVCKEQLERGEPESAKCRCDDKASAKAMVGRALPFLDLKSSEADSVVDELAAQCAKDPAGAIGALVSSLAFAARI